MAFNRGETATAEMLFEEGVMLSREGGIRWAAPLHAAQSLAGLAKVAEVQGNYGAAHAFYEESLTIAKQVGSQWQMAFSLEGLASLAAAQGETTWAVRLWGAAEDLRERIGAPIPPVYRAEYERSVATARVLLGEKAFAAAWAEGRAMSPEQALAAQGQAKMPESTPIAPPPMYPGGLTAREVEVLRLIASGLTDAQVAVQLVISPRTVNTHLTSIYGKIQVTSRSAATRYAIKHQLL